MKNKNQHCPDHETSPVPLPVVVTAKLQPQEPEGINDVIFTKHDGVALPLDVFKPVKPNGAGVIKIVADLNHAVRFVRSHASDYRADPQKARCPDQQRRQS